MSVEVGTGPYEILIRFGPDFKMTAAHIQFARSIIIDSVVEKWEPLAPVPFPLESDVIAALQFFVDQVADENIKQTILQANSSVIAEISDDSGFNDFEAKLRASIVRQNIAPITTTETASVAPSLMSRFKSALGMG